MQFELMKTYARVVPNTGDKSIWWVFVLLGVAVVGLGVLFLLKKKK